MVNRLPYSDIDLERWREYEEIWTDSLWDIPRRASSDGHSGSLHGNFVPQIATQALLRFSRENDLVLDLFLGSGTSAIEAMRLNRRFIGVELSHERLEDVRRRVTGPADRLALLRGDSASEEVRRLLVERLAEWETEAVQLLILHPPYHDIIRFNEDEACLSRAHSVDQFLERFSAVTDTGYRMLERGRWIVLVIGDAYQNGAWVPLGFRCMERLNQLGAVTRSICVKNVTNNERGKGRAGRLWRYRALRGGFYIFKHEYVIFFQKP